MKKAHKQEKKTTSVILNEKAPKKEAIQEKPLIEGDNKEILKHFADENDEIEESGDNRLSFMDFELKSIDWAAKMKTFPKIIKNHYKSASSSTENDEITEKFLKDKKIVLEQCSFSSNSSELSMNHTPIKFSDLSIAPIFEFSDSSSVANIPPFFLDFVKEKKFEKPTPIQSVCWPTVLSGKDVIGIAQTGSGKTFGFLVPGIKTIIEHRIRNFLPKKQENEENEEKNPTLLQKTLSQEEISLRDSIISQQKQKKGFKSKKQAKIEKGKKQKEIKIQQKIEKQIPLMIVLSPTRELGFQTLAECESLCNSLSKTQNSTNCALDCVGLFGGDKRSFQIQKLKNSNRGVSIVVATPGRLLDFLELNLLDISQVVYLVLDEADFMLDLGFSKQIEQVIQMIRPDRQVCLFTATWNPKVERMAAKVLYKQQKGSTSSNFFMLQIGGSTNLEKIEETEKKTEETEERIKKTDFLAGLSVNKDVKQSFFFFQECDKLERFISMLDKELVNDKNARVLVFCDKKVTADHVTLRTRNEGWPALCLHGDRTQKERNWVVDQFSKGEVPILIATDVASRGLDIDDITTVVNFDMPNGIDQYIHRIGRTARAGKKGESISFFTPGDVKIVGSLIEVLQKCGYKQKTEGEVSQETEDQKREIPEKFFQILKMQEQLQEKLISGRKGNDGNEKKRKRIDENDEKVDKKKRKTEISEQ